MGKNKNRGKGIVKRYFCSDSQKIMVNRQVGHMLRTKVSTANEGGVAAGLGALDSPYLIDL